MVKVTVEMVRKRAEHHDRQLAPLEEISLHQEGIEKIEHIQNWCPKLKILLLQSNLIPKIENLNKLKDLNYLNLAINNIEKVENLERCESLQKLDLTLNFIGDLTSITSLVDNYNLKHLYLNGNPCTDYIGYRDYVVATLPQLEDLDSEEIKRSERILAMQNLLDIEKEILKQQLEYFKKRMEQKCRLDNEISRKWKKDLDFEDDEAYKRFWNEKTEHAPEVRVEMDRHSRMRKEGKEEKKPPKKERRLFANDGRPFNINEAKIPFRLYDDKDDEYSLELQVYKHLDTSYIDIDIQPIYVRIIIKGKIFQLCLPEEININESEAKRSQTNGYLTIVMPKHNREVKPVIQKEVKTKMDNKTYEMDDGKKLQDNVSKREFLEIGPSRNIFDFTNDNDIINSQSSKQTRDKRAFIIKVKEPSLNFTDDPDVPPLI